MFFRQIHQVIGPGTDLILTIRKSADNALTVAAHVKMNGLEDEAQHCITPFTASGTPQELDDEFVPALSVPVPRAQGLPTSMRQFEERLKSAEANSKAAKERANREVKEAKERKEAYDKYTKKADEQTSAGRYSEALTNLRQARLYGTEEQKKSLDTRIRTVQAKLSQGTLFGAPPQPAPQIHPAKPPEPDSDEQDDDEESDDTYGDMPDFPEECRAQDSSEHLYRDTLF